MKIGPLLTAGLSVAAGLVGCAQHQFAAPTGITALGPAGMGAAVVGTSRSVPAAEGASALERLPPGVVRVSADAGPSRRDASGLVREMVRRWSQVRDYTACMEKQEWLGAGPEAKPHQITERVRLSPLCLHFKWTGEVNKDRSAVWVQGAHDGKMLIQPHPFFGVGRLWIAPDNLFAKTQSNYDFRDGGLQGLMAALPKSLRENGTVWTYDGEGTADGRPTWRISGVDPTDDPREHNFMELHVDQETLLPAYFVGRNRANRLNIWVCFRDVRTNIGLTDADFDPETVR